MCPKFNHCTFEMLWNNKSVGELLTSGKCRVQHVSLQIITSSGKEVIPKIQNKFNYLCIVECHKIFQSMIFYQPLKMNNMETCSNKGEINP